MSLLVAFIATFKGQFLAAGFCLIASRSEEIQKGRLPPQAEVCLRPVQS